MFARRSSYLFHFPWLEKFISARQKIELDRNYLPYNNISDEDLLNLANYDNGDYKYFKENAVAIIRSNIKALNRTDGSSLGAVYEVKRTKIGFEYTGLMFHFLQEQVAIMDDPIIILVNIKGEYSFHNKVNAENGNFNAPLIGLSIDKFLNQKCLHYPEEKESEVLNYVIRMTDQR